MNNILFITGASSDIGISLIREIQEKCTIIAHFNSNEYRLIELQKECSNRIIPVQADFARVESVVSMLDLIESEIGIPNKVLHLASQVPENIRFKDLEWDKFQWELTISLGSICTILNRFMPKMSKEKYGKVVCMLTSYTIGVPPKAMAHYTTAKYALLGLMKSLASEYADKNITVNCISPSMINTQFLSKINERIVEITAESHPLKRNAEVSDIIPALLMLLSDDSKYINGVNLLISGGSNF